MATRLGIFPAPGGLGGSTLRQLLEQVPPNDVVLVARSPEKLCKEKAVQTGLTYGGGNWKPLWATAFAGIHDGEHVAFTSNLAQTFGREPEQLETTIRNMLST
ncbi:hypothetical protein PENANT_c072G03931 [Penicillium antarcticum]|uniref:NmrA-like domain-containing protein n=1 Tax=Penicillium antarcticum TaxID=416450 RepID=A0A1V6PPE8_9EURO|nr:hypothetical protein PENANT_c072G03931 [Penicillium antarcticum]